MVTFRREIVKVFLNNDNVVEQKLFRKPEGGKPTAAADAGGCQEEVKRLALCQGPLWLQASWQ